MGVSEVSDALTIVVSEETGDVSITMNNQLLSGLSREQYLDILNRELVPEEKQQNVIYCNLSLTV